MYNNSKCPQSFITTFGALYCVECYRRCLFPQRIASDFAFHDDFITFTYMTQFQVIGEW